MSYTKRFLTEHRATLLNKLQHDALDADVQRFLNPSERVAPHHDLEPHTLSEPLARALVLAMDQVALDSHDPKVRLTLIMSLQRRAAAVVTLARTQQAQTPDANTTSLNDETVELLNVIMHDLRSPLVTLRGYVEMMVRGKLGDLNAMQARAMRVASRNVVSLDDQIDTFLEYIRLRQNRLQLNPKPVELNTLFEQSAEALHVTAERKGLAFHAQAPHDLAHAHVFADGDKLKRLIRILLLNALQFTAQGQITLDAQRTDDGLVEISVTDTGPGIPTQDQQRVFEPFVRLQTDSAGAGIGLTVAHAIARAHGAELTLHTPAPGGARFAVKLPLR